eukprot:jgi/Hompol1/6954/HPOL_002395-RA
MQPPHHPTVQLSIRIPIHIHIPQMTQDATSTVAATTRSLKRAVVECLAAIITTFRGSPAGFFRWIFERLKSDSRSVEYRIWILQILKEGLCPISERIENYGFGTTVVQDIIAGLLLLLSMNQHPVFLPSIVDIFRIISEEYPEVLAPSFTQIMEYFITWSLSPITPPEVAASITGQLNGLDMLV